MRRDERLHEIRAREYQGERKREERFSGLRTRVNGLKFVAHAFHINL